MSEHGRRERKKQHTRQAIAEAAARLFAQSGYENVAVRDVAREADVAEQTVYNYFPTKEHLVLDEAEAIRDRLVELIIGRSPGVSPAAALRDEAIAYVDRNASLSIEQIRGGLGHLATLSPAIRRLCLEMTDDLADAIAAALLSSTDIDDSEVAKLHAISLAWVFQTITDLTGQHARRGSAPEQIADSVRPTIVAMLDAADRWPIEGSAGDARVTRDRGTRGRRW